MSNDDASLAHLKQRIEAATRERDRACREEAQTIERQAAARGRLASGNTVAQLVRQSVEDIRIRATMFTQALGDTWLSQMPSPGAIPAAKQMLLVALRDAVEAREHGINESAPAKTLGRIPASVMEQLRADYEHEVHKLDLKLCEWALLQQQTASDRGTVQTTTVNFTGNNNVVNAGLINSTANIRIDHSSTQRLLEALVAVRVAIETSRSLQPQDALEILELVADAEHEIQREQPNKKRLKASLEGVAATIQTVGALSGAYEVLKNAMAMIGIPLP